jgi:uncharacterized protein (TIGR00304 family)
MKSRLPGILLIALGIVLVAISVLTGEARVALVLIIPVIYGGGLLLLGGIICVVAGFLLLFASSTGVEDGETGAQPASERKSGGVLLIGPIPIIFGSDRKIALIAAAIALIVMALLIILLL